MQAFDMPQMAFGKLGSADMHNGLKFTLYQRTSNIVDLEAMRLGQRKWIEAKRGDRGDMVLNPAYPLTADEKDVLRVQAMWTLLGSRDEMAKYYDSRGEATTHVLTEDEKTFLDSNRALYERFRDQTFGVPMVPDDIPPNLSEAYSIARAWLEAHGLVPNADPSKAVLQYRSMLACVFDQSAVESFDAESISRTLAAMGLPIRTHKENVQEVCRNTLHDNPHRPIGVSDYQHAVFLFENSDREEAAFMRGLGAYRHEIVPAQEIQSDLQTLGLTAVGTKQQQWRVLFGHTYRRVTRAFLLAWLKRFDFHLYVVDKNGSSTRVAPETLPKRLLFALLGQFAHGDVVCNRNPGLGVRLSPLSHMLQHFDTYGVPLTPEERANTLHLFPKFCLDKISRKGTGTRLTHELRLGQQDRITPMGVLDALLDNGVYATMQLDANERAMVARVLEMKARDGEQFEIELRQILEPYLRDFDGAFLQSWLSEHNPQNTQVQGLENMLAHYVNLSLCHTGWRSSAITPKFPPTDSPALRTVLENATYLSAASGEPVQVRADDTDLAKVCAPMVQGAPSQPVATLLQEPERKQRTSRADRVAVAACLLDSLYIYPDTPKQRDWLLERIKAVTRGLGHDLDLHGSNEMQFNEARLWLESMASVEVVRMLLKMRTIREPAPGTSLKDLLAILAQSNMTRYKVVEIWTRDAERGYLCWKSDEELQRRLDVLHVNTEDMSANKRGYYFINILRMYLDDDITRQFLTEDDRTNFLREGVAVGFNECYSHYCRRFGSPQTVRLALTFNDELAAQLVVKLGDKAQIANSTECAAVTAQLVPNDAKIVWLKRGDGLHIIQRDETGGLHDYFLDKLVGGKVQFGVSYPDETMESLVAYFLENSEQLLRVDDKEYS